jgi:hypothetical protein
MKNKEGVMKMETNTIKKVIEIEPELTDEKYDDMLDEMYGEVSIAGMH